MGIALIADHALSHFIAVNMGHTAYCQSGLDCFHRTILLWQSDQVRHADLRIFLSQAYGNGDHTAFRRLISICGSLGDHASCFYGVGIILCLIDQKALAYQLCIRLVKSKSHHIRNFYALGSGACRKCYLAALVNLGTHADVGTDHHTFCHGIRFLIYNFRQNSQSGQCISRIIHIHALHIRHGDFLCLFFGFLRSDDRAGRIIAFVLFPAEDLHRQYDQYNTDHHSRNDCQNRCHAFHLGIVIIIILSLCLFIILIHGFCIGT